MISTPWRVPKLLLMVILTLAVQADPLLSNYQVSTLVHVKALIKVYFHYIQVHTTPAYHKSFIGYLDKHVQEMYGNDVYEKLLYEKSKCHDNLEKLQKENQELKLIISKLIVQEKAC